MKSKLLQKRSVTAPVVNALEAHRATAAAIYPGDPQGQANLVQALLEDDAGELGTPFEEWKKEWRQEFAAECAEIEKRIQSGQNGE